MALYKRDGSKYFWMKFTFDGELVQQSTKLANKRDALTVESAYRTQLALGKIGIEPKRKAPTFDKAVDDFLAWSKSGNNIKASSHKRYSQCCQNLKIYFGVVRIDRIKTKDIEKFIDWRGGQKSKGTGGFITRGTINLDLTALKIIFRRLVEGKFLSESPAQTVKKLKGNDRNFHVISTDEEKLYLMASPPLLQDVATVMLETGMRCGEVYQLKRQDVFLAEGYLKVTEGKTTSSIRRVHLSTRAQKVLGCRMNKFKGENLFPQNDIDGNKPTYHLNRWHLETTRKLGLKFRLYDARHTFASRAVEDGIDLLTLSQILGHSDLKMMARYAHPSETFKADAIKQMELNRKAKAV